MIHGGRGSSFINSYAFTIVSLSVQTVQQLDFIGTRRVCITAHRRDGMVGQLTGSNLISLNQLPDLCCHHALPAALRRSIRYSVIFTFLSFV